MELIQEGGSLEVWMACTPPFPPAFRTRANLDGTLVVSHCGLIEQLRQEWNPDWHPPWDRLEEVKATFRIPGTARTTLACRRHPVNLSFLRKSKGRESWRLLMRKLDLPALVVAGLEDGCFGVELFKGLENYFQGRACFEVIEGSGHFMHLETFEKAISDSLFSPSRLKDRD